MATAVYICVIAYVFHVSLQEWEYPRESLVYMKELGEGQFGKVHLMKAKVRSSRITHT